MIYSRPFIDKTLNQKDNMKKINDWDYYTNKTFRRYIYYIPLCTHIFNDTNTDIKNQMPFFFGLKYIYIYFIKRNKLDKESRDKILKYLYKTVSNLQHPKQLGKALRNNLKGCWRYRVDKFRIICELQEGKLVVLVVKVAQRDVVYED